MSIRIFSILTLALLVTTGVFSQSDQTLIYGTISTIDGKKFTGQIRWGKEEALWVDEFNSTKTMNPYNKWVNEEKVKTMKSGRNGEWEFMALWTDNNYAGYHFSSHQFVCRFGDLKALEPTGRSQVTLTFKDDSKLNVNGGSNDIGTTLKILDSDIGEVEIPWERVNRVEFASGPASLKKKMGEPMYGKIKSMRGEFEGFIQWDHEECLSTDMIDGNTNNDRMSIEMGDIKKIERFGRGSKIILKSGRELELFGTNDVDESNRGIVARTKSKGKVLVEWSDFENVEFTEAKGNSGMKYDDFKSPAKIKGTVFTVTDESHIGIIVYDVDESYDYELLEGNDYDVKYSVAFRDIAEITPKNYNYSSVKLKDGSTILLGDSQDVSDRNDGLMIFKSENDTEPILLPWKSVKSIKLQ